MDFSPEFFPFIHIIALSVMFLNTKLVRRPVLNNALCEFIRTQTLASNSSSRGYHLWGCATEDRWNVTHLESERHWYLGNWTTGQSQATMLGVDIDLLDNEELPCENTRVFIEV